MHIQLDYMHSMLRTFSNSKSTRPVSPPPMISSTGMPSTPLFWLVSLWLNLVNRIIRRKYSSESYQGVLLTLCSVTVQTGAVTAICATIDVIVFCVDDTGTYVPRLTRFVILSLIYNRPQSLDLQYPVVQAVHKFTDVQSQCTRRVEIWRE